MCVQIDGRFPILKRRLFLCDSYRAIVSFTHLEPYHFYRKWGAILGVISLKIFLHNSNLMEIFCFIVIPFLAVIARQTFAHAIVAPCAQFCRDSVRWGHKEIFAEFELWWKSHEWDGSPGANASNPGTSSVLRDKTWQIPKELAKLGQRMCEIDSKAPITLQYYSCWQAQALWKLLSGTEWCAYIRRQSFLRTRPFDCRQLPVNDRQIYIQTSSLKGYYSVVLKYINWSLILYLHDLTKINKIWQGSYVDLGHKSIL